MSTTADATEWVTFAKRTDRPKLGYLIHRLRMLGIKTRQVRESFHAPILEVPKEQETLAWTVLNEKTTLTGRPSARAKYRLDDLPDFMPCFRPHAGTRADITTDGTV